MIKSALAEFEIDMENSWMIGDKNIDVETGRKTGLSTAFVLTGYGQQHKALLNVKPDFIASDLGDAVKRILQTFNNK